MLLRHDTFRRLCLARDLLELPGPTIREIALHVGISPYHFIRRFEEVFGVTPNQFRIRTRLDRARLLLAAGNHSVTDICFDAGFESLGAFSRLFTRRVGSAPSAYRRRARILAPAPGILPPQLFPGCLSLMAHLPADAFRNFEEAPPPAAR